MAGLPVYFLGKQGVCNAKLLPVIAKVEFFALIEDFDQISSV